jgi:hypothetical protein
LAQDATVDGDGDNLVHAEEYQAGTNPVLADTDADGLDDFREVRETLTPPQVADTDFDGMADGYEVENGLDWQKAEAMEDPDNDGFPNIFEAHENSRARDASSVPQPHIVVSPSNGDFSRPHEALASITPYCPKTHLSIKC